MTEQNIHQEKVELITGQGKTLEVMRFACVDYQDSFEAMKQYASTRDEDDPDQLWLLEHPAVYTQGTACDLGTFVASDIPVVKTDRGGQITYHGPGQIIMYVLLHLKNHQLGVKSLVSALEQCVIDVLDEFGIQSDRKTDAPGVYVNDAKIAALGLRIRRGNSYHGLSVNVDMDTSAFLNIDPCGYSGLKVTQLSEHRVSASPFEVGDKLAQRFAELI